MNRLVRGVALLITCLTSIKSVQGKDVNRGRLGINSVVVYT